jgi:hypothetical protein
MRTVVRHGHSNDSMDAVGTIIADRTPQSGRTVARSGLRMMPTFPPSPLSFRTAGFPQYGWKAGMSDSAFPVQPSLKPAPRIRRWTPGLHLPCAHLHLIVKFGCPVLCRAADSSMRRLGVGVRLRPRGSRSDPGSSVPGHQRLFSPIRPTRGHIAISPTMRLIRDACAVRECLGDPRVVPSFCCSFLLDMPSSMPSGRSKSVSSRSPISTWAFA